MFVLEKYYTPNQIVPHTSAYKTYEEARKAKEEFYSKVGYHYAEIIKRN